MLIIDCPARDIPGREYFNNITQEFITVASRHIDPIHLKLEHNLLSVAKWESRWHKPFMSNDNMTGEELLDYVRCMTVNYQKNPDVYMDLTEEDLRKIVDYIHDPCSAWVINPKKKGRKISKKAEPVEMIYYGMIQYGIPMECEKWHFNRLMALMDYCDCKGGSTSGAGGPAKRSQKEIMEMYRAMNERNRKRFNSKG